MVYCKLPQLYLLTRWPSLAGAITIKGSHLRCHCLTTSLQHLFQKKSHGRFRWRDGFLTMVGYDDEEAITTVEKFAIALRNAHLRNASQLAIAIASPIEIPTSGNV